MSKVIIWKEFWTEKEVNEHPTWLFIYSDNDIKRGKGGQAIIRYCTNSVGIPTKKIPNNVPSSYYTDNDYDLNILKIDKAIKHIQELSNKYEKIIFPENGFGTGLAKLASKAPKTNSYLNEKITELMKYLS